jgi:hypothetical protein
MSRASSFMILVLILLVLASINTSRVFSAESCQPLADAVGKLATTPTHSLRHDHDQFCKQALNYRDDSCRGLGLCQGGRQLDADSAHHQRNSRAGAGEAEKWKLQVPPR